MKPLDAPAAFVTNLVKVTSIQSVATPTLGDEECIPCIGSYARGRRGVLVCLCYYHTIPKDG
jgi:hypothetical protein